MCDDDRDIIQSATAWLTFHGNSIDLSVESNPVDLIFLTLLNYFL